jgi:MFS family permease
MGKPISKSSFHLHFLCAFFALGSFVWGYNIGILSTIYVNPGFKKALGTPSPSQTGLITAIYYLGTWTSYLFISHPASDFLGRRYAAFAGMVVTCIGSALLAGASGGPSRAYAMMIIGRIIGGLGIAIVSTTVPTYQRLVGDHFYRHIIDSVIARWRHRSSGENLSL